MVSGGRNARDQWHALFMQWVPAGHTLPQLPQLSSSVFVDTHNPEQ